MGSRFSLQHPTTHNIARSLAMSVLRSEVILSLPAVLSCDILSVWLSVPDLVRLDSAYCHHNYRQSFHALYEQLQLVGSIYYYFGKNIRWFLERKIRLQQFCVCVELPTDLVVGYLKDFGRTIESISLSDGTNSEIVEAVRMHCSNTRSLGIFEEVGLALGLLNTLQRVHSLNVCIVENFGENRPGRLPTSNLCEFPSIRKLTITWAFMKMKDIASLVEKCPHLTHFSACCEEVSSKWLSTMFSNLSNLIALDVSALDIDDTILDVIAIKCPLLEHLNLRTCTQITDAGLFSIATNLKLKSISIPCNYRLTDRTLEHLQHCRGTLQALHISHFFDSSSINLSRSAVQTLLQSSQNTCQFTWSAHLLEEERHLDDLGYATAFYVWTKLTDALLFGIAQHGKYLEYLDITEGTNAKITSAGLEAVINNCSVLKQIYVHRQFDRALYADIMTLHANLFVVGSLSEYDIMTM